MPDFFQHDAIDIKERLMKLVKRPHNSFEERTQYLEQMVNPGGKIETIEEIEKTSYSSISPCISQLRMEFVICES